MHAARATRKRRINRGPALNGSARFTDAGEGNGETINAKSLASGAPRNATHFMTKHRGSSVRKNSPVTCKLGGSAVTFTGIILLDSATLRSSHTNAARFSSIPGDPRMVPPPTAVTNARFSCASRDADRPFLPLDHAASTSQTARSSRASTRRMPQKRQASVWGSATGVCAPAAIRYSRLSALRPTFPVSRPHSIGYDVKVA